MRKPEGIATKTIVPQRNSLTQIGKSSELRGYVAKDLVGREIEES